MKAAASKRILDNLHYGEANVPDRKTSANNFAKKQIEKGKRSLSEFIDLPVNISFTVLSCTTNPNFKNFLSLLSYKLVQK